MFPSALFPAALFPRGLFPGSVRSPMLADPLASLGAAWRDLGLDLSVGPLYLNQPPRGVQLPYCVLFETSRAPYFSPRSQRGTQHDLQLVIVAAGESEAASRGKIAGDALEGATLLPTLLGSPYSIIITDETLLRRPEYGWMEERATAADVILFRVRVSPIRAAS